MNLKSKLILQTAPLVLVPIIAIGLFALVQIGTTSSVATQREATTVLEGIRQEFQATLDTAIANVGLFSSSPYLNKYLTTEDEEFRYSLLFDGLLELFATYQAAYPHYVEIRVILPDGYEDARLTVGQIVNKNEEEGDSQFFKEIVSQDDPIHTQVRSHPDTGRPSLLASSRLEFRDTATSNDGIPTLLGYLVVTVDLDFLHQSAQLVRVGKTGEVQLVRTSGVSWWQDQIPSLEQATMSLLLRPESAEIGASASFDGKPSFLNIRSLHSNLHVLSAIPEVELTAPGRQLRNVVIAALIMATVATVLLLLSILNFQLVRPIAQLNKVAQSIGRGELNVAVTHSGEDEIGELASSLKTMSKNLSDMRESEAQHAEDLRGSNERLENAIRESNRARQAAQAASEAKSEFLARMSHEIRTPMNGVLGMTELLRGTDLTPYQQRHTDIIHQSGDALLCIINDILDFSKIEAGKLTLDPTDFSLPGLVRDTVEIPKAQAEGKGLVLSTVVNCNLGKFVTGDSIRLRQILTNLLGNAIKFTEAGEIALEVSQRLSLEGIVLTQFTVSDTGIGIGRENLTRVFDSFDQEDGSTTRRFGGTGLGLAICKQLVGLMEGTISVESNVGRGSTFTFEVPLGLSEAAVPDVAPVSVARLSPIAATVLVAEDEPTNLEVATGMLQSLECKVVSAKDGLEAIHRVKEGGVDIILMDCQMPVMDGFTATEAIRKWELDHHVEQSIPIIALTANVLGGDRERCIRCGMDDYLSKPLSLQNLHSVLHQWLCASRTAIDLSVDSTS